MDNTSAKKTGRGRGVPQSPFHKHNRQRKPHPGPERKQTAKTKRKPHRTPEAKMCRAFKRKVKQQQRDEKKIQKVRTWIPETEPQKREERFRTPFIVAPGKEVEFTIPDGGTLFRVVRQIIPAGMLELLEQSTVELMETLPFPTRKPGKRETDCSAYKLGYWRRSSVEVKLTPEASSPQGRI